jgi:hypothetical protein
VSRGVGSDPTELASTPPAPIIQFNSSGGAPRFVEKLKRPPRKVRQSGCLTTTRPFGYSPAPFNSNFRKSVRGVLEAIASFSGPALVALGTYLGKPLYSNFRKSVRGVPEAIASFSGPALVALVTYLRKPL